MYTNVMIKKMIYVHYLVFQYLPLLRHVQQTKIAQLLAMSVGTLIPTRQNVVFIFLSNLEFPKKNIGFLINTWLSKITLLFIQWHLPVIMTPIVWNMELILMISVLNLEQQMLCAVCIFIPIIAWSVYYTRKCFMKIPQFISDTYLKNFISRLRIQ